MVLYTYCTDYLKQIIERKEVKKTNQLVKYSEDNNGM